MTGQMNTCITVNRVDSKTVGKYLIINVFILFFPLLMLFKVKLIDQFSAWMAKCRHNGPTSAQLGEPLQNCANISQKCRISEKLGNYSTFKMGIFLHHLPARAGMSFMSMLIKSEYIWPFKTPQNAKCKIYLKSLAIQE